MLGRSGALWLAAFGLVGVLFFSVPKQAAAEPVAVISAIADTGATADAYSVVASQAEELIATAAGLFDSGSGRNAKSADQNRQLLVRIHQRLDEYNQAFSKVVSFENERTVNRLMEEYLAAIIGMEEYYRVLAEVAEPTVDQRHRIENLSNAVDAMMQYDDLFIGHIIPGMWLVLDSMQISQRDRWAALIPQAKRRKSLDARIENYKNRLQRALDDSQPTSLAGRAEALMSNLEGISPTYIAKLNKLDTYNNNINFWRVMGDRYLWYWGEIESYYEEVVERVSPVNTGGYQYCSATRNTAHYNREEVATKFMSAMNQIRDRIEIDVKLLHYYSFLLRSVRYALSALEHGIWSVAPNPNQIAIEPEPYEFDDLLNYHDNLVDRFDSTRILAFTVTAIDKNSCWEILPCIPGVTRGNWPGGGRGPLVACP